MIAPLTTGSSTDVLAEDLPDTYPAVHPGRTLKQPPTADDRYPDLSPVYAYISSGIVPDWPHVSHASLRRGPLW